MYHIYLELLLLLIDATRFANTDYALAFTLAECANQRWIMLSYDIWCQYAINLLKRFLEQFPHMADVIKRVRGTIPSTHIQGHLLVCQLIWVFKYIMYSGETYDELIETRWAEQNQTVGSTKNKMMAIATTLWTIFVATGTGPSFISFVSTTVSSQ